MTAEHEASLSIFALLHSHLPAAKSMNVRPTEVVTPNGPVVHAIDTEGFATLLVPVPADTDTYVDWQNRSITFGYRTIVIDGIESLFLALQCKVERLLRPFALLVDDILDSVAAFPSDANTIARKTVDRWREMFRENRQPLLSESQLSGLYGELVFLERLASHHGALSLDSWTGPQGNRHDFELDNASFEVKTTTNHNNMVVAFHGIRQLESTNARPLYVVAHQIERLPQGESLPNLLARIYDSGLDRFELLRKLAEVGYHEIDAVHYNSAKFSILTNKTFLVDENFPRITYETVGSGTFLDKISALQYSVDLGQLKETQMDLQTLQMVEK